MHSVLQAASGGVRSGRVDGCRGRLVGEEAASVGVASQAGYCPREVARAPAADTLDRLLPPPRRPALYLEIYSILPVHPLKNRHLSQSKLLLPRCL